MNNNFNTNKGVNGNILNLNKVKITIQKFATGKYLIISIVILFFLLFSMRSVDGNYLDMRFGYNADEAFNVISNLGVMGRKSYLSYLGLDFGVIIFLSMTLLLIIAILLKELKRNDKWAILYLFPLARGICDIFENILIMIIIFIYPKRLDGVANTSGMVTKFKWILMIITMIFIAIFIFIVLVKKIRFKKHIA